MNPQTFEMILDKIDITIYYIILKVAIAYFVFIMLKTFIENITSYFLFRGNPYVSIGRKVIVDGIEGIISKISVGYITISNDKLEYIIRINRWRYSRWLFLKDIVDEKNSKDKEDKS